MKIQIIAIGNKMPPWVNATTQEYMKRMPRDCEVILKEVPAANRHKNSNADTIKDLEAKQLLAAVPNGNHIIALDEHGVQWSTQELSQQMDHWRHLGCNVTLLIGGADGLHHSCLQKAHQRLSLSKLTYPHPLVRVIIAEQLYRAYSILSGHPYHRE